MSDSPVHPAQTAGRLATLTAALILGGAARASWTALDALDPMLRINTTHATNAFRRDYKAGGMARVRTRMNACWTGVRTARSWEADAKAAYCAAYAYAGYLIDDDTAKRLGRPPTAGFDRETVDAKIRAALIQGGYPRDVIGLIAELVRSFTVNALRRSPR